MRTTGVSGRLVRVAAVMIPMFGLLVLAQAPAPAAPAPQASAPPAQAGQPPQGQGGRGGGAAARCRRRRNAGADFSPKPPVKARTPQEQAKTFILPPGYRMELVVAEPDVISPAVIRFDGNGRMYVAEFITYMRDADGNNQHTPESRITRFESTKGDGVYDKRTVFVDKLVLPRTIVPLDGNSILTNETASDDVVKYTDTNNDGVADKREHFYSGIGIGRDGNLEHEQAGFNWGLDNWIYTTYNAFRIRWTPNGILKEPTGPNGGQWGVTMDDDGKMWFMDAGGERGPMNFQVPIHYGAFTVPEQYEPGFEIVWPESGLSDTQGGMIRVRMPVGRLNHFTAASGADVVRAHRVPADLRGDLLVTEPVGRLIRRARIVKNEGADAASQRVSGIGVRAEHGSALPAGQHHHRAGRVALHRRHVSRDHPGIELDAAGIVPAPQDRSVSARQGHRARPHLAPAVRRAARRAGDARRARPRRRRRRFPAQPALALDPTRPRMLHETAAQLVAHLSHQNGWWRDTAQQLLVQRQDKSVVPALQNLVRTSDNLVARFHALWTLEGLNALDVALVREQMKDSNPRMRVQAIRASETLYKAGARVLADDYRAMTKDSDPDVAIQALLSANLFKLPNVEALIKETMEANKAKGVQEIGQRVLQRIATAAATATAGFTPEQQEQMKEGETIFKSLCVTCHGEDARGVAVAGTTDGSMMGPALAGSPRVQGHRDYVIKTLLHGMTGPLAGQTYTQVMLPDGGAERSVDCQRRRRTSATSSATTSGVRRPRRRRARARRDGEPQDDVDVSRSSRSSLPRLLPVDPTWKATASHNAERAASGLTLAAWTTASAAGA